MASQYIKIKILAKANYRIELMYPQAKACGNSNAYCNFNTFGNVKEGDKKRIIDKTKPENNQKQNAIHFS